jgi:hypothetical protein
MEYGWNKNLEGAYERYLHDYLRVLGCIENDKEDSFDSFNTTAVVGIRF